MTDPGSAPVLVVDDEPEIRALIRASLTQDGRDVVEAANGADALRIVRAGPIAAVILDLGLGAESGYDICRAIRERSAVPILILTARRAEFDEVLGLEMGADDYLTKPFSPRVLRARLAAIIRRAETPASERTPSLVVGALELDERSRRARVGGQELPLTKTEFDLLAVLAGAPDRAFDRNALLDRVWGDWYSDGHVVDVTVGRLRRKLADAGLPDAVETVRGVGYRLAPSPGPTA